MKCKSKGNIKQAGVLCREIQEQGSSGCSFEDLNLKFSSMDSKAGKFWEPAVSLLQNSGLLSQVPGFSDWAFVATEHSAPYFTDPIAKPQDASSSVNGELPAKACHLEIDSLSQIMMRH